MSESPPIGCTDEPVAKRARTDNDDVEEVAINDNIQMDTTESTILERLNQDVLHMVLNCLSTEDILGSITVSKKWRNEMVEYLKGSRYCFEHYYLPRLHFEPRLLGLVRTTDLCKRRSTPFDMSHGDFQNFQTNIRNLGPGIVTIILDCLNQNSLRIIAQNCPNLKQLMLIGMQEHPAHELQNEFAPAQQCQMLSFTEEVQNYLKDLQLTCVMFINCKTVTDEYIGEFLKYDSVEELVVTRNTSVEGGCLSYLSQNKKKKLKYLRLVGCAVQSHHLDSIADHLTNLTMLDLSNNSLELMENVHRLLDRTSKLEYLFLNNYAKIERDDGFVDSLRRLSCLKHLSLCWNDNVSDKWLEALAQGCEGCPGLLTLDIETKNSRFHSGRGTVTENGILTLCRAARELAHLGLAGHGGVTAATVAAVLAACPKLESVDLRGCARVAEHGGALAGVAAPARAPRPLRLRLARTAANRHQTQAPQGLIFDFVDAPRLFRLV